MSGNHFFNFVHKEKKTLWKPVALVLGILGLCLFPVWPFIARLAVFYLCFYLLIAIMLFTLLRLVIYYVVRLLGFEFWILPDIFEKAS